MFLLMNELQPIPSNSIYDIHWKAEWYFRLKEREMEREREGEEWKIKHVMNNDPKCEVTFGREKVLPPF